MAVSEQDLIILPAGILAADIGAVHRIAPDSPEATFSTQTSGQQVAIVVDAELGEHLDVQFSAINAGNLAYSLYDPANRKLISGTANATDPTVLLPPAARAGTYLLLIKPAQAPASWKLGIERSQKLQPDGESLPLATSVAGQKKRFVFSASAEQRLGLGVEALSLSTGSSMSVGVTNRDTSVTSGSCVGPYGGCELNIRAPQSSLYAVVFSPGSSTQTFQANVTLTHDLRQDLQREVPLELVVPRRGQNARLFFNAVAGESLSLQAVGQVTSPVERNVTYGVYKPDGSLLTSASVATHRFLNLPSLPQSGQYFVFVDADYGATLSSRILLSEGVGNGGQVDDEGGEFVTETGGQAVYFTFDVTQEDQRLGVGISDLVLNSGGYVWMYVHRPDGASLASTSCYTSDGGCGVNIRAPMVGRYSVRVEPVSASQTMRLRAWVSTDIQAILAREAPTPLAITRRGQNAYLSLDAQLGETLAIQIAGQSTEPASKPVYYQVYKPDGTVLTSVNSSGAETLRLPTLAAAGRYVLFVDPGYGATLQATVTLTGGQQSGMELDGAAGHYTAPIAGHPAFFTFTTTVADQRLGLALRDIELSSGSYVGVTVYGPGGDSLVSRTCYPSDGGCDLNIRAPKVGIHSVVVSPQSVTQAMHFRVFLSNDQVIDLVREQPLGLSISRFGQNARLKFSAQAGENLALQIAGQSSTSDHAVYYTIYKPDGSSLASVSTRSFDNMKMMKLPATGEYFVFVDPNYGAIVQARVLLTAGNGGSAVVDGDQGVVATDMGGQATFATFEVDEIDQRIGIGISDLLVSSGSYASVSVLHPNGNTVTSATCYPSDQGCGLNVRAPEVGIYGILVTPANATQMLNYKINISNDLRHGLSREVPLSLNIARRGQNGRLTFTAQAGETLALQVVGQTTVPAAKSVYYQVDKPDGTSLISRSISSLDTLNLPTLPASGEYVVFVDPNYGAAVSAQVMLTAGEGSVTVIDGSQGQFTTTLPGQPTYMTFQATAGEQLGLGISDLTVSNGSYVSVSVYRPGGASAASSTCYVSNQGCVLNIEAVDSGTYSVVATPQSASQTAQYKTTLSRDLHIPLVHNTLLALVIARRGQKARLSFTGQAGDAVAFQVDGQATFPASGTVHYRVYKPDGSSLNTLSTTEYGLQELRLPLSGTYQVRVETNYGETVNSRITLAAGNEQMVDEAPSLVQTTHGGQAVRATFQATAGQTLGVGLYDLTVSTGSYVNAVVYRPDGTSVASTTCYASYQGCKLSIVANQTGSYSLAVTPQVGDQTFSYAWLVSHDQLAALQPNQPVDLVLPRRGQNARLSFTGNAGDALALQVAGQTTFPADRTVYYRFYKPDGTSLTSMYATAFVAQELRLPVTGTYQVFVDSAYGETVKARLT